MLRLLKRTLAGLAAGIAINPAARASHPFSDVGDSALTDEAILFEKSKGDYRAAKHEQFMHVEYTGVVVPVDEQLKVLLNAKGRGKRFVNACFTAQAETEEFIRARTR